MWHLFPLSKCDYRLRLARNRSSAPETWASTPASRSPGYVLASAIFMPPKTGKIGKSLSERGINERAFTHRVGEFTGRAALTPRRVRAQYPHRRTPAAAHHHNSKRALRKF